MRSSTDRRSFALAGNGSDRRKKEKKKIVDQDAEIPKSASNIWPAFSKFLFCGY